MLPEKPNIKIGVTHAGICHADEVFATALLKMIYPSIKIMRVTEVPDSLKNNPTVIVYDIGGGEFDHHDSKDLERRPNGVPYSSFGKVWRRFGKYILEDESSFRYIDISLVQPIDKHDNGMETNLLSAAFRWVNMSWEDEDRSNTENFNKAVEAATIILEGLIHRKKCEEDANRIVKEALNKNPGHILILDRYIPVPPDIRDDVYYYIYPSDRDGFNMSTIVDKTKKARRDIPRSWNYNCPEGMKFIAKGYKFANFDTLENAINAANKAISKEHYVKRSALDCLIKNEFTCFNEFSDTNMDIKSVAVMQNGEICILEYWNDDITAINMSPLIIDNDGCTLKINSSISYGMVYKHNWKEDPLDAGMKYDISVYNDNAKNKIVYILYKGGRRILV